MRTGKSNYQTVVSKLSGFFFVGLIFNFFSRRKQGLTGFVDVFCDFSFLQQKHLYVLYSLIERIP